LYQPTPIFISALKRDYRTGYCPVWVLGGRFEKPYYIDIKSSTQLNQRCCLEAAYRKYEMEKKRHYEAS
jgi:hypothetical protein